MIYLESLNDCTVKLTRPPSQGTVTVEIDIVGDRLVPGVTLSRLYIVISEEGVILGGRIEHSKLERPLSVSPESLEAPPDEGWQG